MWPGWVPTLWPGLPHVTPSQVPIPPPLPDQLKLTQGQLTQHWPRFPLGCIDSQGLPPCWHCGNVTGCDGSEEAQPTVKRGHGITAPCSNCLSGRLGRQAALSQHLGAGQDRPGKSGICGGTLQIIIKQLHLEHPINSLHLEHPINLFHLFT